ncbi:MAG TPA: putative toxin-antitoxin system toxin component, PIN family [Ardenticatenaceae bacterium]|jgi:putative PIN family toxin of toxin-antitoxin system
MKRVVLDSNVLVSALLITTGKPARILDRIRAVEFIISEEILGEVERVLHYPRIQRRYHISEEIITEYLDRLRAASRLIDVQTTIEIVKRDPDDDKFFACAIDASAQYIVSGDLDLLTVREYQGIQVVSPAEFLSILDREEADN